MRCHVDAPDAYVPKARYALESLLNPLMLRPVWVEEGPSVDLYYGRAPRRAGATLSLLLHDATLRLFHAPNEEVGQPPAAVSMDARPCPVLFGDEQHPDLIASTFYLLSGWQEVATRARDEYGRYRYAGSLQDRLSLAELPLVDVWRESLAARLEAGGIRFTRRTWAGHDWALFPTFDVDYLRRLRPGIVLREMRRPLGLLRDVLRVDDVYLQGAYRLVRALEHAGVAGTFFFKGASRSAFDPPYRQTKATVRRLIREIRRGGSEIGVHPGYYASSNEILLREDVRAVEELAGEAIATVRNHYLRYEHPVTPRLHQRAGFLIDSSLGFSERAGFRRGTCLPFRIFDVGANCPLETWEMPLAFMDVAVAVRQRAGVSEAIKLAHRLMQTVRRFRGSLVMLWHNTLWHDEMKGWPLHLETILQDAVEGGAYVGPLRRGLEAWSEGPTTLEHR